MTAEEWRNELEALQRLLASQQSQIKTLQKQVGVPEDDAEVDLPAAEYNRVFAATIASAGCCGPMGSSSPIAVMWQQTIRSESEDRVR